MQNCPAGALDYSDEENQRTLLHNMGLCARCGNCWRICPEGAVEFDSILKGEWAEVVTMDLVRCAVCGTPIYTQHYQKALGQKLDQVDALCPEHRKTNVLTVWQRLAGIRAK